MKIFIDENKFEKYYIKKSGGVRHNQNILKIFPYNTKYQSSLSEEIYKFDACIGEFCRLVYNKKNDKKKLNMCDIDNLIRDVEATAIDKITLKSIIKETLLNEDGSLYTFHPKLLNYINISAKSSEDLAKFLYDVLIDDNMKNDIKNKMIKCFECIPNNILENMLIKNLPELENIEEKERDYKVLASNVSKVFNEDLYFIMEDPMMFIDNIENLLKYYYFFYVSQTAIKLSKFFDMDKKTTEELYFNLDWESVSRSRTSYMLGWKMLESNLNALLIHSILMNILNLNDEETEIDYSDINELLKSCSEIEKRELYLNINNVKNKYVLSIKDIDWDEFDNKSYKYDNFCKREIVDFFKRIEYQFIKSKGNRENANSRYCRWFEEYCKINFLKMRGPLGYTLNLTKEQLLFITKICIKDKKRIKLKDLFEEYKKRGICFDRDSQNKIIELFEKLNIIEKKSDSGDAQYVKSIL